MTITTIGLLGFGEVGSRLLQDLANTTQAQFIVWDKQFPLGDSKPAANRNSAESLSARARFVNSSAELAPDCDLIISAVTAEQDLAAASSVLDTLKPATWFLDLNSVSPGTKRAVSAAVTEAEGRYVEAAVMSPIEPLRIAAPILVAGPEAEAFLTIGQTLGFSGMKFCSAELGKAAATKMCRSVIIKGMESLVTESLLTASYYDVQDAVITSLNNLFPRPDWPEHARYLISRSLEHGVRRAEEMREVAKTVSESGIEPLMSDACSKRQDWTAQFVSALEYEELQQMLAAIRAKLGEQANEENNV